MQPFISFALFLLKQYSQITINIHGFFCKNYYNNKMFQRFSDWCFECVHKATRLLLKREPLYDPWATIFYEKHGVSKEVYVNLNSEGSWLTSNHKLALEWFCARSSDNYSIIQQLYHNATRHLGALFDGQSDFLIVLKTRQHYLSRVFFQTQIATYRKTIGQDPIEKALPSILSVEYQHPTMKSSILLHIDSGYFITNNEILSPMFVKRCLEYQSESYVFDNTYTLKMMDSNIQFHTLNSNQYAVIKPNDFEIVTVKKPTENVQKNIQ